MQVCLLSRNNAEDLCNTQDPCFEDQTMMDCQATEAADPSLSLEETDDEEDGRRNEEEGRGDNEDAIIPQTQTASVSKRKTEEQISETPAVLSEPHPVKKKKTQQLDEENKEKSQHAEQVGQPKMSEKPKKEQQQSKKEQQQQSKKQQPQAPPWWRQKPRYFVQELVSHQDIILDVSIADGLVASAR